MKRNSNDEEAQNLIEGIANREENDNMPTILSSSNEGIAGQGKIKYENTAVTIEFNQNTTYFDLYKGIIFMLISCLFKSVYSILLKYSMNKNPTLTPFQLMSWRTYCLVWLSVFIGIIYKKEIGLEGTSKRTMTLVLTRSLLAVISTPLVICSLKVLPISDVYSIFYIYPGLIIVFSLFTKKRGKLGYLDIACLLACLVGVILVIKPEFLISNAHLDDNHHETKMIQVESHNFFNSHTFYYILVGLAAIVKAVEDICVKEAGKDIHFLMYAFAYAFIGILFFPLVVIISGNEIAQLDPIDTYLIFAIAITSFGYISFMALGLLNENAGRVSMVNYLQVVFMYITDIFLFGKKPTILDFIGTLLIFSFNTGNGIYKGLKRSESLDNYNERKTNL